MGGPSRTLTRLIDRSIAAKRLESTGCTREITSGLSLLIYFWVEHHIHASPARHGRESLRLGYYQESSVKHHVQGNIVYYNCC